ncbi:hypothetical protein AAFF_G00392510 [Aldrovandia affinis]|uniref:ATR-interacting protein n=1 Tax=Aldrovandia affinis TaxID=143900 RepID=A0AAD7SEN8_9TELE|nr:hypothetical protein AAFF_G00392510 [Aldrovandia affinis]
MECPPTKRRKGLNYGVASTDPFGDDEDFTQDDLDEIDIIASQAFTADVGLPCPKETLGAGLPLPGVQNQPVLEGRKTFSMTGNSNPGKSNTSSIYQLPVVEDFGNVQEFKKDKEGLSFGKLEAQQAELKKKLKEVEEKLLVKNGEIRVLRDSIRHAQQEKEQERHAHLLLEKERAHSHSEKEKDLLKKVQVLESELHFKEAEMNEIKSKYQNSERGNKRLPSSTARHSPRSGDSEASPGLSPFLTKGNFAFQLSRKPLAAKVPSPFGDEGRWSGSETDHVKNHAQEDPFSSPDTLGCQESILVNLLLQHPLDPSTMGLCHLLSISPDALPGVLQHSYLSPQFSVGSISSSTGTKAVQQQSGFSQAQSLAMSGLNMLALTRTLPGHCASGPGDEDQQDRSGRCPGALHLLPLLEHHIGLFCQMLEAVDCSRKSPLRGSSMSGSSSEASIASSVEETLGSLEEFALAALRALHHLLSQSTEAVHTLLSHQPQGLPGEFRDPEADQTNLTLTCGDKPSRPGAVLQHPLFRKLLLLADPAFTSAACQREKVLAGSLTALNVLAERAGDQLLGRFKLVVTSPFAARCLSVDSSFRTVSLSVSLLALAANDEEVAAQLCSHLEACPLLKMFQYVRSRPDKLVARSQWVRLELEVVRFLTKLFTQKTSSWLAFIESSCQCNNEVVRTLVVLLHRQWLKVRRWECQDGWAQSPAVHLLREALMLMHWLLLNDGSFSDHCLDVLHMYDQVIPAIRETFRKIPFLTISEELAVEEICRPEAEDMEDMDIDSGS